MTGRHPAAPGPTRRAPDARVSQLQGEIGNVATRRALAHDPIQRDIPDRDQWVQDTGLQRFGDRRTTEMAAIGNALHAYQGVLPSNDPDVVIPRLLAILQAIKAWRLLKQGGGVVNRITGAEAPTELPRGGRHEDARRSGYVDALLGEIRVKLHQVLAVRQAAWDPVNFSDPTIHDETQFTYIVNGLQEYEDEPQYMTDLLADPTLLHRALISASVITQAKTPLWCPSGFVLQVPPENVMSTHHEDQASNSSVSQLHETKMYLEITRLFDLFGIDTPAAVVNATQLANPAMYRPSKHNELTLLGAAAPGNAAGPQPVAVFVVVAPGTNDATQPIMVARDLEVPRQVSDHGVTKHVRRREPGVSPARMVIYQGMDLPIIAIPMSASANFSKIGMDVWDGATMITEADAEHLPEI
ncbi:MAG: hypothetical protein AB8G26_10140 [Ilumatobacter sp.]